MALDAVGKKVQQLHEAVVSSMTGVPIAMMGRKQESSSIPAEIIDDPPIVHGAPAKILATIEFEVDQSDHVIEDAEHKLMAALDGTDLGARIVTVKWKGK